MCRSLLALSAEPHFLRMQVLCPSLLPFAQCDMLMGSSLGCFRDPNPTFAFPHNFAISCNVKQWFRDLRMNMS
ncbi:uncharacterized protein EDB91DRAFT_846744 [Suillus paluster]|uniref:uncharacterized protein n=1 Tax=Suillus paluster TaxID=48578 RepID=UPI001B87BAFA|nr:uncharacterized protein EDB91DRAFT_846744 [Suillus paluster]KAG1728718.1 hypothetical protein EDB91DRAFT_846744 [Suillus paluster]